MARSCEKFCSDFWMEPLLVLDMISKKDQTEWDNLHLKITEKHAVFSGEHDASGSTSILI